MLNLLNNYEKRSHHTSHYILMNQPQSILLDIIDKNTIFSNTIIITAYKNSHNSFISN